MTDLDVALSERDKWRRAYKRARQRRDHWLNEWHGMQASYAELADESVQLRARIAELEAERNEWKRLCGVERVKFEKADSYLRKLGHAVHFDSEDGER